MFICYIGSCFCFVDLFLVICCLLYLCLLVAGCLGCCVTCAFDSVVSFFDFLCCLELRLFVAWVVVLFTWLWLVVLFVSRC